MTAALGRLRHRFEARFEALARVQAAVGELRKLTSPTEMLALGPAALCDGSTPAKSDPQPCVAADG